MKKIAFGCFISVILLSCSGGGSGKSGADSATKGTASDTITNVTNPGVGAVSDDTARH